MLFRIGSDAKFIKDIRLSKCLGVRRPKECIVFFYLIGEDKPFLPVLLECRVKLKSKRDGACECLSNAAGAIKQAVSSQLVFYDSVTNIIYSVFIYNGSDLADYRRMNLKELQDVEKSLPWTARAQLKAVGGLRVFMENIFKSQQKMAAIYKEELEAQFPHAKIDIAVNRTMRLNI